MNFRPATTADAPAITALINHAYAGGHEKAWTHEAGIFATVSNFERTSEAEVNQLMAKPGSMYLMGLENDEAVACTLIKFEGDTGYLGMLAVRPDLQGSGAGKVMIAEAERMAIERGCIRMTMLVIATHRPELVRYYERRGYALTGRYGEFSRPAVREFAEKIRMRLEWMEKALG